MKTCDVEPAVSAGVDMDRPLSEEEESAWALLVEEGRVMREGRRSILENAPPRMAKSSKKDTMKVIPVRVRRWVVSRMAGLTFNEAARESGATWLQINEARSRSEEFRCAMDAMEESSRRLMKAKAQSIVEQSQEEGARVSMAQTQVSMRILSSLDREHFGEDRPAEAEEGRTAVGIGGGFVIKLVSDAAGKAGEAPKERPGKALVYTDV